MFAILIIAGLVVVTGLAFLVNLALGIILAVVTLWAIFSVNIVKPEEMGVLVILGKPIKFCNSGIRFVPWFPGCYIERFPKKMYNLDFAAREVISRKKGGYGAQVLLVDSVAYIKFPQEHERNGKVHPLIRILESQIPTDDGELRDWVEDAVVGAIRIALGEISWRDATESISKVIDRAERVFKSEDGALLKAGFNPEDLKLTIKEIKLPKELTAALPTPDRERLLAEAAHSVAERQSTEWVGMVLLSMAHSRGVPLKTIQREIKRDPVLQKEFKDYAKDLNTRLEEAERGAFFEFRAPGAEGIDKSVLSFLALLLKGVSGMRSGAQEGKPTEKKKKGEKPKGTAEEVPDILGRTIDDT